MLRIGCVKYLNARPLICGWPGEVEFDHPSALCERLANGKLDVALVSSFEFLRNPIYRIIDDVSISSDGPVYSVVVAHRDEISQIDEIELDPASETAVNLLRCLLGELGLNPHLKQRSTGILSAGGTDSSCGEPVAGVSPAVVKSGSAGRAQLLIGDQAIRFRQKHADEFQFWDLGEQWNTLMGLPFVYALWLIRPEVVAPEQIADRLRGLRNKNLGRLNELIADAVARIADPGHSEITRQFLSAYYHEHLRFSFGKAENEGLRTFAQLCAKRGLLPGGGIAFDLV
ncbi:MAG TPA: menaquinone biosynthesis protein [Candidatus Udaeobacter sp.]|jgi:predicted solute-binding protein|nr:menaquinone biosynthesis protein [Candidatus Udaeobacter sp.]